MDIKIKIEILNANKDGFEYAICNPIDENWSENIFIDDILQSSNGRKVALSEKEEKALIWVVAHPLGDFLEGQKANSSNKTPFSQELLLSFTQDGRKNTQLPILHLATTDIYASSLYNTDTDEPLCPLVPRSFQIMDSSIWNYLVCLFNIDVYNKIYDKSGTEKLIVDYTIKWKEVLRNAILNIYDNYNKNVYHLTIAHEYADLNARLIKESYLSGAHAKGVAPFIFHSEDVTSRMIEREFCKQQNSTIKKIKNTKWRILLVDDKAKAEMDNDRIIKDTNQTLPWNCKLKVINQLIENQFGIESIPYRRFDGLDDGLKKEISNKYSFLTEYAESLEDAIKALQTKKYDLILLDYLLAGKKNHYGYQLLEKIYSDYDSQKNVAEKNYRFKYGPRKRFYFMFISAYSSAVFDRLLAEGLNQSEDYWFISVGACPTNTPQLFLYNLIKLMEKRLDDSGILNLSSGEVFKLVSKIYPKEDETKGLSVRKRANDNYQKVLSLQYHYRSILKDVEIPFGQNANVFDTRGSVLMTNFIQNKVNLGGLLEHLTQLVHITAFGTVRQWPEMWEEYIYFKAMFEKQLDDVSEKEFRDLCQNIEDYIIKLKFQQQ